uniref:Glutathione S-transferase n=1 Tax=Haliotis diversicolor TaxID=36095 RepID=B3SN78_HALDV|nr:glutathione S-transferase [Haliotis diversicolor]
MPSYKYTYFNLRARGEIPRLILKTAGADFEDNRVEFSEWPALKEQTPFGQLPFIEIDGKPFPESMSISRLLAAEFGVAGETALDRLRADVLTEQTRSMKEGIYKYFFEGDAKIKAEAQKNFEEKIRPKYLKTWEEAAKENTFGSGHLVGKALTIADLAMMDALDAVLQDEAFKATFPETYPNLAKNYNTVTNMANIKKYRESRPQTSI